MFSEQHENGAWSLVGNWSTLEHRGIAILILRADGTAGLIRFLCAYSVAVRARSTRAKTELGVVGSCDARSVRQHDWLGSAERPRDGAQEMKSR